MHPHSSECPRMNDRQSQNHADASGVNARLMVCTSCHATHSVRRPHAMDVIVARLTRRVRARSSSGLMCTPCTCKDYRAIDAQSMRLT